MPRALRQIRIEGNIAFVPLTRGYEAIIDAADVPLVEGFNWSAQVVRRSDGSVGWVYAFRNKMVGGVQKQLRLHRLIVGAPFDMVVDHIDGDTLNNRRSNLRAATRTQNIRNARKRIHNTSGIKGVRWDRQRGKWRAKITVDGRIFYLGRYANIHEAAEAYAKASAALHGEFGRPS